MSLAAIAGPIGWPPVPDWNTNGFAFSNILLIDAASEKAAFIVRAAEAMTVDQVGWATRAVTTGATLDVRIETVGGDGFPTGTLWAANTNGSQVVADANDNTWFDTALTANAVFAKGDEFAVVIVNPAVSFGNLVVASELPPFWSHPYSTLFTASWAKTNGSPVLALRKTGGAYAFIVGGSPFSAINSVSVGTGTTPDEVGNIFRVPFPARITGWWEMLLPSSARDFDIVLYESTTALLTDSRDADKCAFTSNTSLQQGLFSGTAVLAPNTDYRIVHKPITALVNSPQSITVSAAAIMDGLNGGQNIRRTERTDAGAWTETATERLLIGVLIDQLDDGTSLRPQVMQAGARILPVY